MKPISQKPPTSRTDLFEPGGETLPASKPGQDPAVDIFTPNPAVQAHIDSVAALTSQSVLLNTRHTQLSSKITLLMQKLETNQALRAQTLLDIESAEKQRALLKNEIDKIDNQMLNHGRAAANIIVSLEE